MSGRRPAQTKVYSFTDHFREVGPTWTSFPGLFKVGCTLVFTPSLLLVCPPSFFGFSRLKVPVLFFGPMRLVCFSFSIWQKVLGSNLTNVELIHGCAQNNGYFTSGAGKTFHPGLPPNYDGTKSWSDLTEFPYINQYLSGDKCPNDGPGFEQWGRWCEVDDTQHQFGDELTANNSILHMTAAVARKLPFFVAAGFHRYV